MFTHASWAEDRAESYERLEFLGDAVLGLSIARELYERYPEESEGELARIRAHVVSRASCAVVAEELGLDRRLEERTEAASPEELERLASNRNVLSALLEAVIAALFLENGFEAVAGPIVQVFEGRIEYALTSFVDHKTELQERLAQDGKQVSYDLLETRGPPHDRTFTAAALVDGEHVGTGTGRSKKEAEQAAAREALETIRTPE